MMRGSEGASVCVAHPGFDLSKETNYPPSLAFSVGTPALLTTTRHIPVLVKALVPTVTGEMAGVLKNVSAVLEVMSPLSSLFCPGPRPLRPTDRCGHYFLFVWLPLPLIDRRLLGRVARSEPAPGCLIPFILRA